MSTIAIFLAGIGVTILLAASSVAYLKPHLRALLTDLCGTEHRADFWTAFSTVTLVLVPMIFAMHFHPQGGPDTNPVFELSRQLEWALIGFVTSILTLGIVLSTFIPRQPTRQ